MTSPENKLSSEIVQEELKTLMLFIEQHIHWAKSDHHEAFTRLNMVAAESLIESAGLLRALCEKLKEASSA